MSDITVTLSGGNQINVTTSPLAGPLPELQIAAGAGIKIVSSGGVSTISAETSVPANLADLNDVSANATAGQLLSYNGANWAATTVSIPANLADLVDVTANATAGQLLSYNGTSWAATTVSVPANLADLADVTANATAGQALTWDGVAWSAANIPPGTTVNGLSGDVTLLAGSNINLSTDGQNITIGTVGAASIAAITDLTDVNASMTPASGQALVWDGTEWTADAVTALVSNGTTLDLGTGKILYSNVYPTLADLPDAASYHGMFAHVHDADGLGTGAAYYAHAGNWVRLADDADVPAALVSSLNGLAGPVILSGDENIQIEQSGNQLTISSTQVFSTLNGGSGALSLVGADGISVATVAGTITVSGAGLATEGFVNQAVADLVNAAPQTLDTLAELANALNNNSDFAANVTALISQKADANHTHVKANITDLTTGDLDMQGNRVLFANYYAAQSDFPDAATYHGMVAHSHADGAFYGAHAGAWVRLANQNEIPAATSVNTLTGNVTLVAGDNINVTTSGQNVVISGEQGGIVWSTPPQNGSSPGNAGDIAYDDSFLYLRTSQAWRQVALSPIATNITISQQPSNQSVGDGDTATFTVLATAGGEAITYQWEQSADNGSTFVDVANATSNSLTVTANLSLDGYQYRASLSAPGAADVTTSVATLTVAETFDLLAENGDRLMTEGGDSIDHDGLIALTITQQPQNTTASGGEASFAVAATVSDGSTLTYQWEEETLAGGGETWVQRTLPASASWRSVTYGNGTFVAVAYNSNIAATSPDGINWTQRTLPASTVWDSVAYGSGTFVAVSGATNSVSSNIAATSTDGVTWTQQTLPASAYWSSVTYGNGTFVAVESGGGFATSPDGINWTQGTLFYSGLSDVAYGNGTFVAVRQAGANEIAHVSTNGVNWTQVTLPASAYWSSVTYGNGTFVAVADGLKNIAATSPDGVTWTQQSLPAAAYWGSVTYGNGTFVALSRLGGSIPIDRAIAATSPDGINWTPRTLPRLNWSSVTYGDGTFVAVESGSNIAATSESTLQFLPLSGETTPTLNLTGLTTADDGERYRVVVDSPSVEPVTSDAATLATPQVVSFTAQPQNTTAIGGNATFTALAEMSDGTAVTYQWQELIGGNWTDIAGETSQNLALTGLVASDDGEQYRVVADGDRADPVTSNAATLTTPQVVSFTTQPQNTTAAGGNATFTSLAEMSDGTNVTYQWQELIGSNWTDIAGETGQNLALTGLVASDDGEQYRVVADGDRADPVTSNVATLIVNFTAVAGAAYAVGWNYFGQLGRGDFENIEILNLIDGTSSTNRPEGGQLYTSGWDLYGQRGDS